MFRVTASLVIVAAVQGTACSRAAESWDADLPSADLPSTEEVGLDIPAIPDLWPTDESRRDMHQDPSIPDTDPGTPDCLDAVDANSDAGPNCLPGGLLCASGLRMRCAPGGQWQPDPCPGGMACDEAADCVPNPATVYLVLDTVFQPDHLLQVMAEDLCCKAVGWARSRGAVCPLVNAAMPEEPCRCDPWPEPGSWIHADPRIFSTVVAYLTTRILDALSEVPGLRIVVIHPPVRTAVRSWDLATPWGTLATCMFGSSQAAFGATPESSPATCPSPLQHYATCFRAFGGLMDWMCGGDTCTGGDADLGDPPAELLDPVFAASVVGYPEPWDAQPAELRTWVDGTEGLANTNLPCQSDSDCGLGTCSAGTCWVHSDPEIRSVEHAGGPYATPMLYLAAQFLRTHADRQGAACITDADCRPLGTCSFGTCRDPAFGCRTRHVVLVTPNVEPSNIPQIHVARWMNTGLQCGNGEPCANGSECELEKFQLLGAPEYRRVCSPPPAPASTLPTGGPTLADYVAWRTRGGEPEFFPPGTFGGTARSGPIRATTNVVAVAMAPYSGPTSMTLQHYPWQPALAVAGGGNWVLPANVETPNAEWLAPYVGSWEGQLEALVDRIRSESMSRVCTLADVGVGATF